MPKITATVLAAAVLVTGCTATQAQERAPGQESSAAAESPPPVLNSLELKLKPAPNAEEVVPAAPVTVKAEHGELTRVTLIGKHGTVVKGGMNQQKTEWRSAEPLGYTKQYTLTARGIGEDGETVKKRSTFTTVTPAQQVSVQMTVPDGATVGVGMPISFQFSAPISDKDAAERALQVKPSRKTEGAFHWFSDSWVVWRPKKYWKPGTKVKVNAKIYGTHLGGGIYGSQSQSRSMKIGEKLIAVADGKTHQMTVRVDGRKIKTIPISMGKPTHPTHHGIYTVMSEHRGYTMDSSTYGVSTDDPEGYRITVDYATRMSNSGIFYHSAPWSEVAQGNSNTSHGCLNLSTANAAWLMEKSKPGDLIEVVNSGGAKLEPTNGWSFWQLSWKQWKSGGVK
ncbi:MAG: L,D-transpeptidase family protein [Actinophytocola sp.]|nr:L,D-transpeptidase family protein [Actinophytocola sp.]